MSLYYRRENEKERKAGALTHVEVEVGYPFRVSTIGAPRAAYDALNECMLNQSTLSLRAAWFGCKITATGKLVEFAMTPREEGRVTTFDLDLGMAVESWRPDLYDVLDLPELQDVYALPELSEEERTR